MRTPLPLLARAERAGPGKQLTTSVMVVDNQDSFGASCSGSGGRRRSLSPNTERRRRERRKKREPLVVVIRLSLGTTGKKECRAILY